MKYKKTITKVIVAITIILAVKILVGKVDKIQEANNSTPTMERFLQNALVPVGSTMYIWGGGWDDEDSKSGASSTQIGASPQWENFTRQQEESYDYTEHRFERENGLDCSGYVGWVIYNTFEAESGKEGYVTKSTDFASSLASRGWGRLIKNPKEFLAGDIVSMEGHVWICLGTCSDGSVLLVHSSPPGVSICGTILPGALWQEENGESSIAIELAKEYMESFQPRWQEKFPNRSVDNTYLEDVILFRWSEKVFVDAKIYQAMSAEELLNTFY